MFYQFLDTFYILPYSLLWFGFQYEPTIHVKKSMFLFIAGSVALLHSLDISYPLAFIYVCLFMEIAIRIFIIL